MRNVSYTKLTIWIFTVSLLFTFSVVQAVPERINYQGTVSSGDTAFQGMALFRFAIMDDTGTVQYWSNDGSDPPVFDIPITVNNGLFNVILGYTNGMDPIPASVFENEDVYLRIWFNDLANGYQILVPDQQILTSGFAFKAADADTLGGIPAADLEESAEIDGDISAHTADTSAHHTKTTSFSDLTDTATDAQIPDDISLENGRLYAPSGTGFVGIGTNTPAGTLHVYGGVTESGPGTNIILEAQDTNEEWGFGGNIVLLPGAGPNYGGGVGINTTNPQFDLDVIGAIYAEYGVFVGSGTPGFIGYDGRFHTRAGSVDKPGYSLSNNGGIETGGMFLTGNQDILAFSVAESEVMRLQPDGNVGIGTTSPAGTLHVDGGTSASISSADIILKAQDNTGIGDGGNIHLIPGESTMFGGGVLAGSDTVYTYFKTYGSIFSTGGYNVGPSNFQAINSSNQHTATEGSATGPGFTFAGATGTGMFRTGSQDVLAFSVVQDEVMRLEQSGNVGIGTTSPGFLLEVAGTAGKPGGGSWSDSSDARLKENIQSIDGRDALEKLGQLQGVTYEWINPEEHSEGTIAGVTAQNLEDVFPDWVEEIEPKGKDADLIPAGEMAKAIHFPHDFNAYLIEAIKELAAQNETLKRRIEQLEKEITSRRD